MKKSAEVTGQTNANLSFSNSVSHQVFSHALVIISNPIATIPSQKQSPQKFPSLLDNPTVQK